MMWPALALLFGVTLFQDAEREAFYKRLAERRQEASKRLAEAERTLAEQQRTAEKDRAAFRKRLADKPLTLSLRSGESVQGVLLSYSFVDLEILAQNQMRTLPWHALIPEAITVVTDAIFLPDRGQDQFERGRILMNQRMWHTARIAFERAAKLDGSLRERATAVLTSLDRTIAGQGTFHGEARRLSPTQLSLKYDWKNESQILDFTEGLTFANGMVNLEVSEEETFVYLDMDFVGEVDIEGQVSASTDFTFDLLGEYLLTLGLKAATLEQVTDERTLVATDERGKIERSKPTPFHIIVRDRKLRLLLADKEALVCTLPSPKTPRGAIGFGMQEGKATFHSPLSIRATLDRRDLDKRFAAAEILARRAADPDLKEIEEAREKEEIVSIGELSSDDPFLAKGHGDCIEEKQALVNFLAQGEDPKKTIESLDALVTRFPQSPTPYYLRALYYHNREQIHAAQLDLSRALTLFPEFAEAWTLQARLHDWDNNFVATAEAAQKAIDALPDQPAPYVLRALADYARDPSTLQRGLQSLQLALALDPGHRESLSAFRALRLQARGPADLGCRFEYESTHYRIATDISAEAARRYAEHLEAAYGHFAETFKRLYQEKPFPKPRVTIFNTAESYYTYSEILYEEREEDTLGHYIDQWNELVLIELSDERETLDTLYHEAFHHFITLSVPHTLPYWYNEGIAEYMAAIRVEKGKVVEKALVQPTRLSDLQYALEEELALPFEEIMNQTPSEFYDELSDVKYAEAWSMIHFFYEFEKGKYRPLLEKYVDQLRTHKTMREAFDAVFRQSCSELEAQWSEYVKSLK